MKRTVILLIVTMFPGCALFKKTTKTTVDDERELNRQTELNKLAVKKGQRETNVYTYWPDGSVYQWENKMEQLDEAKFGKLTVEEKAVAKTEGTRLESVPSKSILMILLVALIVIIIYIIYK